jgi:uncharacterized membrane protein
LVLFFKKEHTFLPMLSLIAAALFFILIHLGVSGTVLRDRFLERVGLPAYMVGFSVASVIGMVLLVRAYKMAPYVPLWGQPEVFKPVAIILMLPAFLLVVIGLTTPNPTAVAQEALVSRPPEGIVCVTRHPFLVGASLWAVVHMIANGDAASLLFFGAFAVVSMAGTVSIDAKRRRVLGAAAWDVFASKTSIVPFAAIIGGRAGFSPRGFGWWRVVAGGGAYALMLGGHAHIIGVSPFP